jgi:hypothetical protein
MVENTHPGLKALLDHFFLPFFGQKHSSNTITKKRQHMYITNNQREKEVDMLFMVKEEKQQNRCSYYICPPLTYLINVNQ